MIAKRFLPPAARRAWSASRRCTILEQQALRAAPACREPRQPLPAVRLDGPPAAVPAGHAGQRRRLASPRRSRCPARTTSRPTTSTAWATGRTPSITPEGGTAVTQTRNAQQAQRGDAVRRPRRCSTTTGTTPATPIPLIAQRGNGNIINDGTRIYAYDALNRLSTVKRTSDDAQVAAVRLRRPRPADPEDRQQRRRHRQPSPTAPPATCTTAADRGGAEPQRQHYSTLRQFVWGIYIDELMQMKTYANTGTQPLAAGVYYPLQDLLYRTTAPDQLLRQPSSRRTTPTPTATP